jgi:hypothetical protein
MRRRGTIIAAFKFVMRWPAMSLQRLGQSADEDLQLGPRIVGDESEEVVVTRGIVRTRWLSRDWP